MEMEEGTEGVRATVKKPPRLIALRTEYESAAFPPVRVPSSSSTPVAQRAHHSLPPPAH